MSLGDVIARLAVNLALETGAFEEGADAAERRLNQSAKRFEQIGGKMMAVGAKMSLAFTAPLAALAKSVLGLADDAKALQNSAKLAGETFEQFQRGAAAAKTMGVEYDKFGDILKDTQDKLGDFAANGGGELQDFFTNVAPKVGVTIDMFKELSGSQALQLYYDSLVKAGVPQQQMVFYLESIADEASALAPILANNGKLMKEVGASAAIISDSDAAGLARYTQAQSDLASAFTRLQIALAKSGLVEAVTAVVAGVAGLVDWFAQLPAPIQQVGVAIAALVAIAGPLLVVLGTIISSGATVFAALGTIGTAMASTGSVVGALTVAFAALRAAVITFVAALGPVGLALAALSAGIAYFAYKSMEAKEAARELKESIDAQTASLAGARGEQSKAAAATGNLTQKQREAIKATAALTGEANLLGNAWARVAAKAKAAAIETANADLQEARRNVNKARTARQNSIRGVNALEGIGASSDVVARARQQGDASRQQYVDAAMNVRDYARIYREQVSKPLAGFREPDAPKPYTIKKDEKKKAAAKSTMATDAQQQRELDRLAMEELQAKLELATSAEQRASISREILAAEKAQRIAEVEADKTFTADQKKAQIAYLERLFGAKAPDEGEITVQPGLLNRALERQISEEQMQQANDMLSMQAGALQAWADIEPNTRERARLEREALVLQQQIQTNLLEQQIATGQIADKEKARALLASQQSAERQQQDLRSMSPIQRYGYDLRASVANINDALEDIQVSTMESLTNGLAGAIAGTQKLGQVFKNVAQSIIADLARIAIQKALTGAIGNALGSLGGIFSGGTTALGNASGGFGGSANWNKLPSITGAYASGTNSAARGLALVGERGPELVKFKGGERVYNSADSKAMMSGRSVRPYFDLRGALTTADIIAQMNQVGEVATARGGNMGSVGAQVALARKASRSIP